MYKFNKDTLEYEKIPMVSHTSKVVGSLIGVMLMMGFTSSPRASLKNITKEEKYIVIREYNNFTEDKLIQQIKDLNFRFPYIILAQSYHETGHYTSFIFKNNFNLFGMKEAQMRVNLAKGTKNGHAYYDSWQDSVKDYALFNASYLSDIKTEGEYFEYLKQNYAEDPNYVERLKRIIKTNNLKSKFN
jgi:hypothetical protein